MCVLASSWWFCLLIKCIILLSRGLKWLCQMQKAWPLAMFSHGLKWICHINNTLNVFLPLLLSVVLFSFSAQGDLINGFEHASCCWKVYHVLQPLCSFLSGGAGGAFVPHLGFQKTTLCAWECIRCDLRQPTKISWGGGGGGAPPLF